ARRIETAGFRKLDRLSRSFEIQRDRDLIGELGHLARAREAHMRYATPQLLQQRARALECGGVSTDHDRQRALSSTDVATRNRRIEVIDTALLHPRRDSPLSHRRDSAHIDDELTGL